MKPTEDQLNAQITILRILIHRLWRTQIITAVLNGDEDYPSRLKDSIAEETRDIVQSLTEEEQAYGDLILRRIDKETTTLVNVALRTMGRPTL